MPWDVVGPVHMIFGLLSVHGVLVRHYVVLSPLIGISRFRAAAAYGRLATI